MKNERGNNRTGYQPGHPNRPEPYVRKSTQTVSQNNFRSHPDFQEALRLWRQSHYWETHEVLESLWKDPVTQEEKHCLQAFIQICAAALKSESLNVELRLLKAAQEKLNHLSINELFGISLERMRICLANPDQQTQCYQIQKFEIGSETPRPD